MHYSIIIMHNLIEFCVIKINLQNELGEKGCECCMPATMWVCCLSQSFIYQKMYCKRCKENLWNLKLVSFFIAFIETVETILANFARTIEDCRSIILLEYLLFVPFYSPFLPYVCTHVSSLPKSFDFQSFIYDVCMQRCILNPFIVYSLI